jgi:hypothetical protein
MAQTMTRAIRWATLNDDLGSARASRANASPARTKCALAFANPVNRADFSA